MDIQIKEENLPIILLYKNYLNSTLEHLAYKSNQILYNQINDYITEFTLNRPEKLNSITLEMTFSLLKKVHEWTVNDFAPKVVISSGNGRGYCTGSDLKDLYNWKLSNKGQNELFRLDLS